MELHHGGRIFRTQTSAAGLGIQLGSHIRTVPTTTTTLLLQQEVMQIKQEWTSMGRIEMHTNPLKRTTMVMPNSQVIMHMIIFLCKGHIYQFNQRLYKLFGAK